MTDDNGKPIRTELYTEVVTRKGLDDSIRRHERYAREMVVVRGIVPSKVGRRVIGRTLSEAPEFVTLRWYYEA